MSEHDSEDLYYIAGPMSGYDNHNAQPSIMQKKL